MVLVPCCRRSVLVSPASLRWLQFYFVCLFFKKRKKPTTASVLQLGGKLGREACHWRLVSGKPRPHFFTHGRIEQTPKR
eukprot:662731-Rhodomonas_salina.1